MCVHFDGGLLGKLSSPSFTLFVYLLGLFIVFLKFHS